MSKLIKHLKIVKNPKVELIFANYPESIKKKMFNLRDLIIETANEIEEITSLEETLKWGEPSYVTKKGSTIRMDWKKNKPDQFTLYFQCTSKLIPTFKMIYKNVFNFEGNRAIVFHKQDKFPKEELKKCIATALRYHSVKHLPSLGI